MSARNTRRGKQTTKPLVHVPPHVRTLLEDIGRLAQREGVSAYAVGGCVRDWLLSLTSTTDVDVAIEGDGIAFAKVVGRALGASVTSHEQFGTATLELPSSVGSSTPHTRNASGSIRIDIASCRQESYTEAAAYPKVRRGRLSDDLCRRDFTINAMAMAIIPRQFGKLIDPYGGQKDLHARRLRILHPQSFLDDPSRILRAGRFVERFGLRLDPTTSRCLRRAIGQRVLARLNRGRLRKELDRLVEEPNPIACLQRIGQWLTHVEKF